MTQELQRLRYSISSWSQATKCLSNNSKDLHISVADYIHNVDFEGQILSVVHTKYGTMFATITNGQGHLISETDEDGRQLPLLTTEEVLRQLEKFGFDITYAEEPNLSGEQLTFLTNLYDLGYDAITRVRIKYPKITRTAYIAYNSSKSVKYLKFDTMVSKTEFDASLECGEIANIAKMDTSLEWDWLTYTCQISDLLDDNSVVHRIDERSPVVEPPIIEGETVPPVIPEAEMPTTFAPVDPSGYHIYGAVEILGDDNADVDETSDERNT